MGWSEAGFLLAYATRGEGIKGRAVENHIPLVPEQRTPLSVVEVPKGVRGRPNPQNTEYNQNN